MDQHIISINWTRETNGRAAYLAGMSKDDRESPATLYKIVWKPQQFRKQKTVTHLKSANVILRVSKKEEEIQDTKD